jgi:hypothetical protein
MKAASGQALAAPVVDSGQEAARLVLGVAAAGFSRLALAQGS